MSDYGASILFVVVSVVAAALALQVQRRESSAGLAPLVLAGLAALWAIAVTTLTTFAFWGEHPSRAEVWAARGLVALACGAWLMAAMLQPGATPTGRVAASALAVAAFATSSWLVGG